MEGDETLTLTEEKVSHPSTLELARLTSKCLPFPVLEKSRKSYTLPKKGMSKTSHKSGTIPELPLIVMDRTGQTDSERGCLVASAYPSHCAWETPPLTVYLRKNMALQASRNFHNAFY